MNFIEARLGSVSTAMRPSGQVGTDKYRIDRFVARKSEPPPILAVKKRGCNTLLILDGHHRFRAARKMKKETIQAWIIRASDFKALLKTEFDGSCPFYYGELDSFIKCGNTYGYPFRARQLRY